MKRVVLFVMIVMFTNNIYAYTVERETDPGEYGHSVYGECDNGDSFSAHSYYDEGYWKLALNGGVYSLKSEHLGDYKKAIRIIFGENDGVDVNNYYAIGDRVYVHFQSGKKCPATIIMSGKNQNKIEYNSYCGNSFISSKQKGEQEWAPNHALSKR